MTAQHFGGATPILRVTDIAANVAWWTNVLGFHVDFHTGDFAGLSAGDAEVMLCQNAQGHAGTWLYIGVSDVDVLHHDLLSRGARIRVPPTNYPWGARELHVFDPDDHVIRFGSGAKHDEPFGPWLSEDGTRWQPQPDGTWTKIEH